MRYDKSGAQVLIDFAHHAVHHGFLFTVSDFDTDIDIAAPKYWLFRTPNTNKRIHIIFDVGVSGGVQVDLYESPTITADGTAITPFNNDFNRNDVSVLLVFKDPTVTADGTLKTSTRIGASGPGNSDKVGGNLRPGSEYILKQNTNYILKITSDANDTKATMIAEYYEV